MKLTALALADICVGSCRYLRENPYFYSRFKLIPVELSILEIILEFLNIFITFAK